MIYVMSDIHGCKDEYMEALKQIDLKVECSRVSLKVSAMKIDLRMQE